MAAPSYGPIVEQVMAKVTTNRHGHAVLDRALAVLFQAVGRIGNHAKLRVMEAAYSLTAQRQSYINSILRTMPSNDVAITPANHQRVRLALTQSFEAAQLVDESFEGEDFVSRMAEAMRDFLKALAKTGGFVFSVFLEEWWPLVLVAVAVFAFAHKARI